MSDAFNLDDPSFVDAYDELPLWSAMAGLLLLRHVRLRPGCIALDLGCGTGFPAIELAERLGSTARVHGVDPWVAALARARRRAATRGVGNVTFHAGVGGALPFADDCFDLIVSNLGVNNFADPAAALGECRRVLRAGGRLALSTNLQGHMAEFYTAFRAVLPAEDHAALDAHIGHRATVEGLLMMLAAAGFTVTRVEREDAMMRFADGAALLRHSFIRLGFLPGWQAIVPDARRDRAFAALRAQLDLLAAEQGDLTLTVPLAFVEATIA